MQNQLFEMCAKKSVPMHYVYEVGVYLPETSKAIPFIQRGAEAVLVDADPICVQKTQAFFEGNTRVSVVNCAVADSPGEVKMYRVGASTFLGTLEKSPALVNDAYKPSEKDEFSVAAVTFDKIDNGKIDVLIIDIEGAEWYVLKHMTSRPAVIGFEFQASEYKNPYAKEILNWLSTNGYTHWFYEETDAIFIKQGVVEITAAEKLTNGWSDFWIEFGHNRQSFVRKNFKKLFKRIKAAFR